MYASGDCSGEQHLAYAKADRGRIAPRARIEPNALPRRSYRKTASMTKRITVCAQHQKSRRVQITSPPSADIPEMAIPT